MDEPVPVAVPPCCVKGETEVKAEKGVAVLRGTEIGVGSVYESGDRVDGEIDIEECGEPIGEEPEPRWAWE